MAAGTDIFISYKREEQALAESYATALRDKGFLVVTDLNLPQGERFGKAIDTMIREATLVVVLWTPASVLSDWVQNEAVEAYGQGKYYGVVVKPVSATDLPMEVRREQFLDVSDKETDDAISTAALHVEAKVRENRIEANSRATAEDELALDMEFFAAINAVDDLAGYQEYLERHPAGVYREEAQSRIRAIGTEHAQAKDRALFKEVNNIGGVDGYRHYLFRYPDGIYSDDARAKVAEITRWTSRLGRYIGSPSGVITTLATSIGALATIYATVGAPLKGDPASDTISQLQNDIVQITDSRERLASDLGNANLELKAVKESAADALSEVQAKNANLVQQLADNKTELEKAMGAYSEENRLRKRLEVALERQRAEHEKTLDTLAAKQTDSEAFSAKISELQSTLMALQSERDSAVQRGDDLEATLAQLEQFNEIFDALSGDSAALNEPSTHGANPTIVDDVASLSEQLARTSGPEFAAYESAQRIIGMAKANGSSRLDLSRSNNGHETAALTVLPPEITELNGLQWLALGNTAVSNLNALQGMSELRWLDLSNTQINDLSVLNELHKLQALSLEGTQISEISALRELGKLRELDLRNTLVDNLEPIANLSELQRLYLEGANAVTNLAPLRSIDTLHYLEMPDGSRAGAWNRDTPENRSSVRRAILNWKQ